MSIGEQSQSIEHDHFTISITLYEISAQFITKLRQTIWGNIFNRYQSAGEFGFGSFKAFIFAAICYSFCIKYESTKRKKSRFLTLHQKVLVWLLSGCVFSSIQIGDFKINCVLIEFSDIRNDSILNREETWKIEGRYQNPILFLSAASKMEKKNPKRFYPFGFWSRKNKKIFFEGEMSVFLKEKLARVW